MSRFKWILLFYILLTVTATARGGTAKEDFLENIQVVYKDLISARELQNLTSMDIDMNNMLFKIDEGLKKQTALKNLKRYEYEDCISCMIRRLDGPYSVNEFLHLFKQVLKILRLKTKKIPCQATRESISLQELESISNDLRKNPLILNEYPNGRCADRSYLVSHYLDKKGIKSGQISLVGNIYVAYKMKEGFRGAMYGSHYTNTVWVDVGDKKVEYVLDPMFTDQPMRLTEYMKMLSERKGVGFKLKIKKVNQATKLDHLGFVKKKCEYLEFALKESEEIIKFDLRKWEEKTWRDGIKVYPTREEARRH